MLVIRHLCIPFPYVRLRLSLEDSWSSDDEESTSGPPNSRGYEDVKPCVEPGGAGYGRQVVHGIGAAGDCGGHGAKGADPNVVKRGLLGRLWRFLDAKIKERIPSLRRMVVNVYDQEGVDREWKETMVACS